MSDNFIVRSSIHDYKVYFENEFSVSLGQKINEGDIILIDKKVHNLYKAHFTASFAKCKYIVINASEEQKSYLNLAPIIESLIENNFRKNNKLIAVGGGITQDIAAFISANMYRGVQWIFYPTTLLAQCDSCIGGKSSINFGKYKNQLGNFYPPKEIFIDLTFLDTLSELDIRSGLGEMIHFYLVSGEDDFNKIRTEYKSIFNNKDVLKGLIYRSLQIKKAIIEIDEFDKKERQLFNYGHSFGHAIESLTDYRIPHGIAVSYGMDIANYLSQNLGYISVDLRQTIRELLKMNWNGFELSNIDIQDFLNVLKKDKKNVGSEIKVILTQGFGKMFKATLPIDNKVTGCLEEYFIQAGDEK